MRLRVRSPTGYASVAAKRTPSFLHHLNCSLSIVFDSVKDQAMTATDTNCPSSLIGQLSRTRVLPIGSTLSVDEQISCAVVGQPWQVVSTISTIYEPTSVSSSPSTAVISNSSISASASSIAESSSQESSNGAGTSATSTASTSSTQTTRAKGTTSSSPIASSTALAEPHRGSSDKTNTGLIAGVAVVAALLALALAALVFVLVRRRGRCI